MPRKKSPIPVNNFGDVSGEGLSIERLALESLPPMEDWGQPERHDRHSFFLLEKGSIIMEIDFERYRIQSPAVIYMHPDQVHQIINFERLSVIAWAITNEMLDPNYPALLEDISPAAPVMLNAETFDLLSQASALCIKIAEKKRNTVYDSVFKAHLNALAGLVIAIYTAETPSTEKLTRPEFVTKAFRKELAQHFTRIKSPAEYAEKLNLSATYLNECVKSVTGQPVSYHIQHRVILEAKRLLYHSDQSLKEVAAALGYDDYPYFSRLFTKVAGLAPLTFRRKNRN
ncbi:AraC family transcriptional regulator [Mucilaginibacter sp. KACC 22063]|uniref:AraC family transcriptional regulator n=1 Tax=Mucilaginibacter sp. KACC 22063 TaxID=3025666 RepID=UPI0023663F42|nr:helix-turn-helix transcriptional regulator [Mucilaginibacter sp. KACC 22063]WDF55916.1 helix-turn-helix transcriptional regulator [Mucilaginibacter sp. KACC 22063]